MKELIIEKKSSFQIWDLSDPVGKGYLDKKGFFVSLKLVSLAQSGLDVNMRNILSETNQPKCVRLYNRLTVLFVHLISSNFLSK